MSAISKRSEYRGENLIERLQRVKGDIQCCVQRIRKGYCFRDAWDIDMWFLTVIPEMLKDLRSDPYLGFPAHDFAGLHYSDDADRKIMEKAWERELHRMEMLFREANPETCRRKNPYEEEYYAAVDLMPESNPACDKYFDYENRLARYRKRCLREGLRLFCLYFNDLWS